MCRYSKIELAKQKVIKELEEEYGAPIDEILEYVDDEEEGGKEKAAAAPATRQDEVADEEATLGDGDRQRAIEDEEFDEYSDPDAPDPYSYEGLEFSSEDESNTG